jgi:hypothetical protein
LWFINARTSDFNTEGKVTEAAFRAFGQYHIVPPELKQRFLEKFLTIKGAIRGEVKKKDFIDGYGPEGGKRPPLAPEVDSRATFLVALERAIKELEEGHIGRAIQALESLGVLSYSKELEDALKLLYPQDPEAQYPLPASGRVPIVQPEEIEAVILTTSKGKGGGRDGWMPRHFKSALSSKKVDRTALLTGLTAFANDLAQGKLHVANPLLWDLLSTAKGTPLRKSDDPSDTKPRPVGVIPFITSLTIKAIMRHKKFKDDLPNRYDRGQLGMGKSGGVEALPNAINALRSLHSGKVLLALDSKNAFNSIHREFLFTHAADTNPELGPLIHLLYGKPNKVIYSGRGLDEKGGSREYSITITATRGTTQGSPEAGASYDVVHDIAIRAIRINHPNVIAMGIHDDWYFFGEAEEVIAAYD